MFFSVVRVSMPTTKILIGVIRYILLLARSIRRFLFYRYRSLFIACEFKTADLPSHYTLYQLNNREYINIFRSMYTQNMRIYKKGRKTSYGANMHARSPLLLFFLLFFFGFMAFACTCKVKQNTKHGHMSLRHR